MTIPSHHEQHVLETMSERLHETIYTENSNSAN